MYRAVKDDEAILLMGYTTLCRPELGIIRLFGVNVYLSYFIGVDSALVEYLLGGHACLKHFNSIRGHKINIETLWIISILL